MPPSAVSSRPGLDCTAPGERASFVAEQIAHQQGLGQGGALDPHERPRRARDEHWCRCWASTSLPTPVSPRISTLMVPRATRSTVRYRARICSERGLLGRADRHAGSAGRSSAGSGPLDEQGVRTDLHAFAQRQRRPLVLAPGAGRAAWCRWRCPGPGWLSSGPVRRRAWLRETRASSSRRSDSGPRPTTTEPDGRQPVGGEPVPPDDDHLQHAARRLLVGGYRRGALRRSHSVR